MDTKSRNGKILEMLSDGQKIKNFYRFTAQNPHIPLHNACQIVIERPNASVCFGIEEWNAMGRRVKKGKSGISFINADGERQFVFDANDTYGDKRYTRLIYPMKRLLIGLDELNGTDIAKDKHSDYKKIHAGIVVYLTENGYFDQNEEYNRLLSEGISYSLYSKTGFPKDNGIVLHGMTDSLQENAQFFKEIYEKSMLLQEEIDDAYVRKQEQVEVINDIEEENISDEPIVINKNIVETQSAVRSNYKGYVALVKYNDSSNPELGKKIYLGKTESYDNIGHYDNTDNSLVFLSDNPKIYGFLYGGGYTESQQAMVDKKLFSPQDYKDFYELQQSILKNFECTKEIKFGIDVEKEGSGVPFKYPNWQETVENPKGYVVTPFYQQIVEAQEEYTNAIVISRLGDFYETLGENAKKVSDLLDLTLTGRNVGLPERVPMCGFPYHTMDMYIDKILHKYPIVVLEYEEQPKYIMSYDEAKEMRELEQSEANENVEDFEQEFDTESIEDEMEETEKPIRPQEKQGKPIKDRKKKDKPQFSLFDLIDEPRDEQSPADKLKEWGLKRGSGFADGKLRIYEEYQQNPTINEFADFLKNEYGTGGSLNSEYETQCNAKGLFLAHRNENKENDVVLQLKWTDIALGIANLIDDNNYFSEQEKEQYFGNNEEQEQEVSSTTEQEIEDIEPTGTDLSEIGIDSSEHGGAKSRFINNLKAIRLVNNLYRENRTPTDEEKKVLAKYVGWGGLAEAFDERNEKWQKEYQELKQTLSIGEYENAKASVLNAHYTSKEVIQGMYNALSKFGVKGGNKILEPAMGTGNFFGYMPKDIAEHARLYGVELDNITGKIASKLYPNVNVQIKGFEQTSFTNDSFDIMVSNVPFGAYSVYDSEYAKHNFYIHDYFIAKGLDKLKPNGLMAVITSKGTMDKLNPTIRKYLADRAELVGAIRLPNTAFQKTANTQVVTDIWFFQKRNEKINADANNTEWLATTKTEQGFEINNYYATHPEMVLGTMVEERGMYGAIDVTVKPDDRNLEDAISQAIEHLPANIYQNTTSIDNEEHSQMEVDYEVKPLCFKAENGKLYVRMGDSMVLQTIPKSPQNAYERIAKMIDLRNQLRHILDIQISGCSDFELQQEQRKLNQNYDQFVKKYGYLNNQTNKKLFKEDGDSALLFASEEFDENNRTATKADIFRKRTIRPYIVPTNTDDCYEALQISKNERGNVDIAYIEQLTNKDYDTVLNELDNAIFRNPIEVDKDNKYSGFETAEEYLSGNVAKKLHTAKMFEYEIPELMDYSKNIQALEEVQPERLTASDISVRLGASWVQKEYYTQFLCELLQIPSYYSDGLELYYNQHDSSWKVNKATYIMNYSRMQVYHIYGTSRANAYRLFEDCLNLKSTSIYDTVQEDGREKRVLNQSETIAAREKQNKIKDAFKDWIFAEPDRRESLENTYNALFNQIKLPSYDGSYLKFPEMNPAIELKDHQKNAVSRIITSGNTLLHHVVGSGKTFTICATIMKLRQYGLAKKPMIAVPNHLVGQWADEFRKLYPNANLLIASKEDLAKENRQKFVSRVAMGDWDAVIIAQSSFAKIPISPARQINKIREEIGRIETTIEATWEDMGMPRGAVKNLERIKKNRETQLKKLLDDDKKDNVLTFESLGVDYLFVDEAHYYKNLFLFTKMNNVAGISTSASQRASDLELKCEYINEIQGGDKGVVFATGTPISNSMTEMYTMQTYLQKKTLQEAGITYFDSWAADFGETTTSLEMSPSGQGYKAKTRFAKFTNLPELLTFYRSFADVQTSDMVKLDVPEVDRNVVTLKPSETVISLAEEIAERAEKINGGGVDPHIDNMLKVTSDGKKLALDPRCFDDAVEDESGSKVNECAFRVFKIWQESTSTKGTQLVFCDLSTPKKAFEDYEHGSDFDVYNDLKYKLVQMGIPEEEIAFIHDANTDDRKQRLFENVNSGNIRVLIGSTGKCGAGTNVQQRLVALHHLDTPYRPSDLAQREGRIVRQGNTNEKVQIFTYVTERTFDSYSYQILENKQRFISQIDKGDLTVREADDIDETTLSYAEIKAITAANPKIKRKMEVDTEVARLRVLEGQYKKNLYSLQDKIRKEYPEAIKRQELYLERARADIELIKQNHNPEIFKVSVLGKTYTDKKDGARALQDTLMASTPDTVVAEYGGFKLSLNPLILLTAERSITLTGNGKYSLDIGASASGNITRLDNFMQDFASREERIVRKLEQLHKDYESAQEQAKKPFEHQEILQALVSEQVQLNAELDLNKREEIVIDDTVEEEKSMVENENHMGVPIEEIKKASVKPRKKIKDNYINAVSKEQSKMPEAYIFIANGDYYDILGEKAVVLANNNNLSIREEIVNDKSEKVLSLSFDEFDSIAKSLVASNEQLKIIEPVEENNLDFDLDIDKELNNALGEMSIEEVEEFLGVEEMDYKQVVIESVEKEFNTFKHNLLGKDASEIFNNNYEIHIKTELFEVISDSEYLDDKAYRAMFEDRDELLGLLYDEFLSSEYSSVNNYGDTAEFIKDYCYKYHEEIMNNELEEKLENKETNLNGLIKDEQKPKWQTINVSRDALIKQFDKYSYMKMPETNEEYKGYGYNVWNNRIKESTQLVDMQSDSRELSYELLFRDEDIITINKKGEESKELTVKEFMDIVANTSSKDYARDNQSDKKWYSISVPQEANKGMYESASLFVLPNTSKFAGCSYYVPNAFVQEDKSTEAGNIEISIPEDFEITIKNRQTNEKIKLTAFEYYQETNDTKSENYVFEHKENILEKEDKNDWKFVSISGKAKIAEYENRTLLKMPSGEYEGYSYYLPNGFIKENTEKGTLRISMPKDFEVALKNGIDGTENTLNVNDYIDEVSGKDDESYTFEYNKPSEIVSNRFKYEEKLRKNVPDEMKSRPNWVIVRTKENADTGRLEKYLIDPKTGKFAESDNPNTWTDFESACKYAKENGGETLAYALDGKDKVCSIDVDKCIDENGDYSPLATSLIQKTDGTYMERSISGKGIHFFGKTDGMDIRTFSKDGKLEFYQRSHFIAMTGDTTIKAELKNIDRTEASPLLRSMCEKRTEWKGVCKGIDGLSQMSDIDVVEKAQSAKHGDTFKALYSGQDLQNNHSNSDMSLMNRLAFWCNGDKEQMLRIFATSGLYRAGKSPDYYEGTAVKAIKDTVNRYQPQPISTSKPTSNSSSGKR